MKEKVYERVLGEHINFESPEKFVEYLTVLGIKKDDMKEKYDKECGRYVCTWKGKELNLVTYSNPLTGKFRKDQTQNLGYASLTILISKNPGLLLDMLDKWQEYAEDE